MDVGVGSKVTKKGQPLRLVESPNSQTSDLG
jgi:hypothetical protein